MSETSVHDTYNQASEAAQTSHHGISFQRYFTNPSISPYDQVEWELRTSSIANEKGKAIFEQHGVEVPKSWSQTATNIVTSKYFHGKLGTPEREKSVRELVSRVVDTIAGWGLYGGYFATPEDADNFRDELAHLMLHQKASFNSPVWFNCGVERCEPNANFSNWHWSASQQKEVYEPTGYHHPQCSACFINSVQDSLDSILTLAKTEGMLFKWGSGTGSNLSSLRSSDEALSGGGSASGPLSFMRGFDAFAGVIKSGGKTRRAAKMVILNIDHPDVVGFIECKAKEERKAWALVEAGYDSSLDGEAYSSIFFQNANNSVRVTDDFMQSVEEDREWHTREVTSGNVAATYRSRDLMSKISTAAHQCGDPGMQYDTTINRWHTCKNSGRINASNPCSEYMFLDDSACNLSSLNLMKFLSSSGQFDAAAFRHAVDTMTVAQEIIVDNASYPTEKIGFNSHNYRPLGLGYANLGALLMATGLPYDSDAGRGYAATVTALMHGQAYLTSARIAEAIGPFPHYEQNREPMLEVIAMHREALGNIDQRNLPGSNQERGLYQIAEEVWKDCYEQGERHGYRNSQVTVLAPTGTIGFMMDCDTTGVEPDLALVKYKKLVGGGVIKVVNNTVPEALVRMGYGTSQVNAIVDYVDRTGTIEGAPNLKPEHLAVFDCSFRPAAGSRCIHYMGHVRMMAAVQPFISGAISKTVNLPEEASVEDVMETYSASWKMGLKAVAIYRDGSKRVQPLSASSDKGKQKDQAPAEKEEILPGTIKALFQQKGEWPPMPAGVLGRQKVAPTSEMILSKGLLKDVLFRDAARTGPQNKADLTLIIEAPGATDARVTLEDEKPEQLRIVHQKLQSLRTRPMHEIWNTQIPEPSEREIVKRTVAPEPRKPARRKLPEERNAKTHKFSVAGHEGYITVGMYEDGQPGEIFIVMAKEGSTVSGLMDSFATAISLALQYGVPLKVLVDKFSHTRFEPSGWTGNKEIPYAKSIMDYMFRWLSLRFLPGYEPSDAGASGEGARPEAMPTSSITVTSSPRTREQAQPTQQTPRHAVVSDAPSCADCGAIMTRNGSCYKCENCGSTSGCS